MAAPQPGLRRLSRPDPIHHKAVLGGLIGAIAGGIVGVIGCVVLVLLYGPLHLAIPRGLHGLTLLAIVLIPPAACGALGWWQNGIAVKTAQAFGSRWLNAATSSARHR